MSERGVKIIGGDEDGEGEIGGVVDYRRGDQGSEQKKPGSDDSREQPGLDIDPGREKTPAEEDPSLIPYRDRSKKKKPARKVGDLPN
ncbi:MAG: hypothetical protein HQ530_02745 [Parcubacteria group bacterium]|nr:hypothetical protein [Parcubacteria group bacterium]